MTEKYGEIKIMNQDEYIKYYNKNIPRGDHILEKSKIFYRNFYSNYSYDYEWPDGHSNVIKNSEIVVYDSSEPIVYLKSDQILNIENNKKLLDNLTKNNSYIIHVIGIEFHQKSEGKIYKKREILFIDNYCNYHKITTGNINEDYYHTFISNENISNIPLPNSIIDSIKNMKNIIQTINWNDFYENNNIYKYF